ncbi:putative aliphatic sulfonates-binding protein [Naviculisporaceae sp. PSN 640]
MHLRLLHLGLVAVATFLFSSRQVSGLRVSYNVAWIEGTPLDYTSKNVFKTEAVTTVDGGIHELGNVDIAGNAETQGLKQYVNHKNYRLIYIVVEVAYRLVAHKAAGIRTLADLRGKRVGTVAGSSAEVFVHTLLESAGVKQGEYTQVSGGICMRAPCAENSFPGLFKARKIDAYGLWETAVELGIQAVGGESNVVVFKNASIYREIWSLYAKQQDLANPTMRKKIVQYVKDVNQTLDLYKNQPEKMYPGISKTIKVDVPVLRNVWEDHVWGPSSLTDGVLLDYLIKEDKYLAKKDNRAPLSRADLQRFIDPSVYEDALKL